MAFQNYKTTNNAQAQLLAGISASAGTVILQSGQGSLFPSSFPFLAKLEKYDTEGRVIKREEVKVTAGADDTFTIVRSFGYCPASYSATTQTNTAFSFDSDDTFSLTITAEQLKDVQDEITRLEADKLDKAGGTRTGLTVSRILKTDGSGNEGYVTPWIGGQFLSDDLTFKTISTIDAMFGDGSDGDLVISSGTTNLNMGTVYSYSSVTIAAGANLSTSSADGILIIKCRGTTGGTGTINLSGKGNNGNLVSTILSKTLTAGSLGSAGNGGAGGTNGGTQAGGGTAANGYGGGGGGGGAGAGVTGGLGGNGGTPGGTGGTTVGSGGAGGSAYGNNGVTATYTGTSTGAGGNGGLSSGGGGHSHSSAGWSSGGGGAGGNKGTNGGNLALYSFDFSGAITVNCSGAAGGNGGAGGGGGTSGGKAGGGGGGGAGGGGGCACIVSGGSAFAGSVSVALWSGGTGGAAGSTGYGGGGGVNGSAGTNGTAGQSYVARLRDIY